MIQDDFGKFSLKKLKPKFKIKIKIKGPVKWLKRAASVAGRAARAPAKLASGALKQTAKIAGKVPIVGKPLGASIKMFSVPFAAADRALAGERIDRVALNSFKDSVQATRDIAPYAAMIVAFVPGLGTGIAAGIAGGLALAEGQPLGQAVYAGVRAAIPGGALGKLVLDAGSAAARGENLMDASVQAALRQLPPAAQTGLKIAAKAARGGNIAKASLEEARKSLPTEAQKALDIAVAVGTGRRLQDALVEGVKRLDPVAMGKLAELGAKVAHSNPIFKAGLNITAQKKGYNTGLALMSMSGVSETTIAIIRRKLPLAERTGFDLAVAVKIGIVTSKPPTRVASKVIARRVQLRPRKVIVNGNVRIIRPVTVMPKVLPNPVAQAGFYMTVGMVGGGPKQKTAMMEVVAKNPEARSGAVVALGIVKPTWWEKVKAFFTSK